MATQTLKNVILQLRTGSATQWVASTRILAVGEPGVETDSGRIKIGDGTNLWSALPWSGAAIGKSSTNGALTINGADVVVYVLPTATSDTLGGALLVCQTYVTPYLMKSWSVSFGDFHPSGRIGKQL